MEEERDTKATESQKGSVGTGAGAGTGAGDFNENGTQQQQVLEEREEQALGQALEVDTNIASAGDGAEFSGSSRGEPKLFVGQIDKAMNEDDLRNHLAGFGKLEDVRVLRNARGESKCCAMVLFGSMEEAENAINCLNGKQLVEGQGRNLVVSFAKSKDQNGGGARAEMRGEPKLFVGQIDKAMNEDDLRNHLAGFGKLEDVRVLRNARGESKCCAMVLFGSMEEAENAISRLNGKQLVEGQGRNLVVSFARSKKRVVGVKRTFDVGGMMPERARKSQTFDPPAYGGMQFGQVGVGGMPGYYHMPGLYYPASTNGGAMGYPGNGNTMGYPANGIGMGYWSDPNMPNGYSYQAQFSHIPEQLQQLQQPGQPGQYQQ